MGEAKRRGSTDERVKNAMNNNEKMLSLIKDGKAPHYAFVLDRSAKGLETLAQLMKGPDELKARAKSHAVELWKLTHFEFIVIWGTWGYSGGLTVQALNIEQLLNEALPAVIKRTLEKRGLCSFMPAIDEIHLESFMNKIAELQPIVDSNNSH